MTAQHFQFRPQSKKPTYLPHNTGRVIETLRSFESIKAAGNVSLSRVRGRGEMFAFGPGDIPIRADQVPPIKAPSASKASFGFSSWASNNLENSTMRFLLVLVLIFATDAAPTGTIARQANRSFPAIIILKQIYQVNDDGSYTFGYEADDGTYRVENRDDSGYITGKYGYLDSAGSLQEIEYAAGKYGGRSIGYQAKSPSIPVISRDAQGVFPVVKQTSVSAEQRAPDYEYNSVDDNQDGIPDKPPNRRTTVRPVPTTPKLSQQIREQIEITTQKTGSANLQEITKMAPESSSIDERKAMMREKEMSSENVKGEKVATSPAVNVQASKQIVEFPEVGASTLNTGRLVDRDSNLMPAESKVTELEQSLPTRPPTKDDKPSQGLADDDESLTRGTTSGKLEEFLRDLVARTKTKPENKTPLAVNQKPTTAPTAIQLQSAPNNNVETLGFTRII